MNDKAKIDITLQFAENNLDKANDTLMALIEENLTPANGELRAISERINSISSKASQFKKLLGGVKELDEKRKLFISEVKEKKENEE